MKQCTLCKIVRRFEDYRKQPQNRNGLQSWCKFCQNASKTRWGQGNKEKVRAYNQARYHRRNDMYKGCRLLRHWPGVGWQQALVNYEALFQGQNKTCGICGLKQDQYKKNFSVDHCHKTGLVRGLLCSKCNILLGHASDSVAILEKAILYLKERT